MLLAPHHLAQLHPAWRAHYRRDGRPKLALTAAAARQARADGLRTYRCRLCGYLHAATRRRRTDAARLTNRGRGGS